MAYPMRSLDAEMQSLSLTPELRPLFISPDAMIKSWHDLAKTDYTFYVEFTHRGTYVHGKHTKFICEHLQKVETGEIKRLMIFTPPRHSKSMSVTETFPSYFIGRDPERRVIQTSYSDDLARKFGRANRAKINDYGNDIFNISLSRETSAANNWGISGHRGGMISAGIGGTITGEGADLLLIDDPIKNKEEANSRVYRDKVWGEWTSTLRTRLHPGARVVIILTRWHEDDLAGRLLNPEYGEVEDWTIINLPAIAEEDDMLGREVGEPLWPEHGFDLEWAESTKKAVGETVWASLYQQRPSAAEGAMIKREWFRYYHIPYNPLTNTVGVVYGEGVFKEFYLDEVSQSWDMSFKDSDGTDMVVGGVWGRCGANHFLLHRIRKRIDFPNTIIEFKKMTALYPQAVAKFVEDKANGPAVISSLKNDIQGIIPITPKDSKIARVSAVSPLFEAGNVFIPSMEIAPWSDEYKEELVSFPRGTWDDQVDMTTQYLNKVKFNTFSKQPDNSPAKTSDQNRISKHIKKMIKERTKKSGKTRIAR